MNTVLHRYFWLAVALTVSGLSHGQTHDLKVMHYNILNYRNATDQCTNTSNSPSEKEGHLKRIFDHAQPDILTVNEIGANAANRMFLLQNSLDPDVYGVADYSNNGFSTLTNGLFYRKDKLVLHAQDTIAHAPDGFRFPRVIDYYRLYLLDKAKLNQGDTTFLSVLVCHLKAGHDDLDRFKREKMVEGIQAILANKKLNDPVLLAGDLNIRSSTEDAYQMLTQKGGHFVDPIMAPGQWHNKSDFAYLHTQSTRTNDTEGGCASGGGMDDRFDFILLDSSFFESNPMRYKSGSYQALGQDGKRFNKSLNDGTNTSVPAEVRESLYEASDHLPIVLTIEVSGVKLGLQDGSNAQPYWYVRGEHLVFEFKETRTMKCKLVDMTGKTMTKGHARDRYWKVPIDRLSSGVYYMQASNKKTRYTQKVILK